MILKTRLSQNNETPGCVTVYSEALHLFPFKPILHYSRFFTVQAYVSQGLFYDDVCITGHCREMEPARSEIPASWTGVSVENGSSTLHKRLFLRYAASLTGPQQMKLLWHMKEG